MKKLVTLSALLLAGAGVMVTAQQPSAQQPPAQPAAPPAGQQPAPAPANPAAPQSLEDQASYIIGLNIGRNLKAQEVPANPDIVMKGIRDGLSGAQPVMTDQEMEAAMGTFQQQMMAKQQAKIQVEGQKNQKAADDFLATNKAKKGVVTTASGLQYEVVKEGTGASPKATDQVTVHYTGTLLDGTKFDSSVDRGQPATFPVNQVIPGWTEALQLMKVGGKYKLYIPPALGYGERGAGGEIGPNSLLVFEVELVSIGEQAQAQPEAPPPAPPGESQQ
ncbi:MAG TPA: FKBP-type peptidyl-prolyl cis-trans isomerase [Thermoanaerobaculia bacterium]|nr:FKBP-type peptidyl-prolyl cis-trans isomerase [Thermoanaerobaculia bacterium]